MQARHISHDDTVLPLKGPATDKYDVLARIAARWGDPATREPATDSLIATGPVFSALAMARWMRSDSVAIAVLDRASRDRGQVEARFAWGIYAFLGPRLRADPRLQPAFRALGYPEPVRRQTPGRCVAILFSDSPAAPRIGRRLPLARDSRAPAPATG